MKENQNDTFLHKTDFKIEDILSFIDSVQTLFWKVDLIRNKIEFLNDFKIEGLGDNTELLLKSMNFAESIICTDDIIRFRSFKSAMAEGRPASIVFRIKIDGKESYEWIKIVGAPSADYPSHYVGYIQDISETVPFITQTCEVDKKRLAMVEQFDYPIILIDFENKKVLSHNSEAAELLGYSFNEFNKLTFQDLYHQEISFHISKIYEKSLFDGTWEGKLLLHGKKRSAFYAECIVRSLNFKGKTVLRLSIHKVYAEESKKKAYADDKKSPVEDKRQRFVSKLTAKVAKLSTMPDILDCLLKNQFQDEGFDSIMYSDIYIKRGKIKVFAYGDAFKSLKMGATYNFEGTIAENIEKYKLDYLIVDDTFKSIKPIDWALFIPHGVRSYFAKPCYERNNLRTVLILCSSKVSFFSEEEIPNYELLFDPFGKGLKNWRKANR